MALFDEVVAKSFQDIIGKAEAAFFEEGLVSFQETLRDKMNELMAGLQKKLLEQINHELVKDPNNRRGWVVERHGDQKSMLSPFGEVTYMRTYFRNKKTGEYAYLVDKLAGYTPHQRLDLLLEADVLEDAAELSFRKAGKGSDKRAKGTEVSGQTVLNIVRKLKPEQQEPNIATSSQKRSCPVLYIEADEDHVANQDREGKESSTNFEQKLVYVHEGRRRVGEGRHELINTRYFTFPSKIHSTAIWSSVWNYIQQAYEIEDIEHIFVSGDGASWIQAGVDYLPASHFVLDRFHIQKAIVQAAGANKEWRKMLTKAVWQYKRTQMNQVLREIHQDTDRDAHKKRIERIHKYLNANWNGIRAYKDWGSLLVNCSAEGHVSHILSARLSSRPMGWTRLGANQMAHLRVHKANNVDLKMMHLDVCRIKQSNTDKALAPHHFLPVKKAAGATSETLDNIPALHGTAASLRSALRALTRENITSL